MADYPITGGPIELGKMDKMLLKMNVKWHAEQVEYLHDVESRAL